MKKKMLKKLGLFILISATAVILGGCGEKPKEIENVSLSLWVSGENEMYTDMINKFKEEYKDEAVFNITISNESEATCKETVLASPERAADLYIFADDQLDGLYSAGTLLEITENTDDIIKECGGKDTGAIKSVMRDNKIYAYPVTAGNGYFLYYNSKYFNKDDIKSLDRIIEIAEKNNKKFYMDFTSGWYIYSFFKGAGLDVNMNDDGTSNSCNWNATDTKYKGVDVAEAMLKIARSKAFISGGDDHLLKGIEDGSVIACVNGTWNSVAIGSAYGDNYAASKLPEYTINGDSVQMCSFAGYKLLGVNKYTKYPQWAMKLARYLTNSENQLIRFETSGETPANADVAASEEVQKAPAVAALAQQSKYGYLQRVAESYWTPTSVFGTIIVSGNPDREDMQKLLDDMNDGITAKAH